MDGSNGRVAGRGGRAQEGELRRKNERKTMIKLPKGIRKSREDGSDK